MAIIREPEWIDFVVEPQDSNSTFVQELAGTRKKRRKYQNDSIYPIIMYK
jgi:hypothetical protein